MEKSAENPPLPAKNKRNWERNNMAVYIIVIIIYSVVIITRNAVFYRTAATARRSGLKQPPEKKVRNTLKNKVT